MVFQKAPYRTRALGESLGLGLLVALILVPLVPVLRGRGVGFVQHGDNLDLIYPWYAYVAYQAKRGELALWNPYEFSGHLFAGDPSSGALYPVHLLWFWLGPEPFTVYQMNVLIVLHFLVAALGAYTLLRQLGCGRAAGIVAGIVFAFGGYMGLRAASQSCIFEAASWLPWTCAALVRGVSKRALVWSMLGGAAFAFMWVGGHVQPPVHGGLLVASLALFLALQLLWETRSLRAALTPLVHGALLAVTGLLLAAPQLLVTAEYGAKAFRWIGASRPVRGLDKIPYELTTSYSFQTSDLANLAGPFLSQPTEANLLYFSVAALVLASWALVASGKWPLAGFLWLVAVAALLYGFGASTPLHWLAYEAVPLLDKVRQPSRISLVITLAVAVLAGLGVEALTARCANQFRTRIGDLAWLALVGPVVAGVLWMVAPADFALQPMHTKLLLAAIWLGLTVATIILVHRDLISGAAAAFTVGAIVAIELGGLAASPYISQRDAVFAPHTPDQEFAETDVVRFLRRHAGFARIVNQEEALPVNAGNVLRLYTTLGYGASMFVSYYSLLELGWDPFSTVHDMLGAKYFVTKKADPQRAPVHVSDGVWVYENPEALPRAWLVHQVEVHPSDAAVRGALGRKDFDPRRVALATYPILLPLGARPDPSDRTVVTAASAHALSVHTSSAGGGLLVVSDPAYPGWQAFIDGQPTRLHEVYGVFRGVVIPPGEHDVTFRFDSLPFTAGLVLTGFGLLAISAAGVARAATVRAWSTGGAASLARGPRRVTGSGRRPGDEGAEFGLARRTE